MAPRMMIPGASRGGTPASHPGGSHGSAPVLSWGEASVMPRTRLLDRNGVPVFPGSPVRWRIGKQWARGTVVRLVSLFEVEVRRTGVALAVMETRLLAVTGPFPGDQRLDWQVR